MFPSRKYFKQKPINTTPGWKKAAPLFSLGNKLSKLGENWKGRKNKPGFDAFPFHLDPSGAPEGEEETPGFLSFLKILLTKYPQHLSH